MSRERLNWIIRGVLVVGLGGAFALSIIAARPGYRFFGNYPAALGTPQPIKGEWNIPAAYATLDHVSVVSFPQGWALPDQICATLRLERGEAPTALPFPFRPNQLQWDDRPAEAVMFAQDDLIGHDYDGQGIFYLSNGKVAPFVTTRTPYRVSWFGTEITTITPERGAGGLFCFHFAITDPDRIFVSQIIPFSFHLIVRVKNIGITEQPIYYFAYNVATTPPTGGSILFREDIESYLARVAEEAPFAVQRMTAEQQNQRAQEATHAAPP
ncbi:MAG TPA: hypothetical protein PLD47_04080 [Aggregatilineales bacterium]|nr:hypothetical protein [Anaerolineales bacterium]HRE46880.1 hypothetical protein [Aggregatilineales bacterium]